MTRLLPLLLAAWPLHAQEAPDAAPDAAPAPAASASVAEPAGPAGPLDPVAAWTADPTAVLSADGLDLAAFEYLARPLVIFADSPRQPQLEEQLRLLAADPGGLAGRDVAVIVDSDPAARSPLRQALRPRGFGVVLVDKDGRVALRRPQPLSVRDLGRAIDRSPGRQEELRLRRGGGTGNGAGAAAE